MSIQLMTAVWKSALPTDEKFVALALADWADDNGERIYPSQHHLAWKVGKSDRATRDTLTKLQARGVLVVAGRHYGQGGHGATIEYRIAVEALPMRGEWVSPFHSEETSDRLHSEVHDTPPGSLRQPTRKPTSDDPLSDPLVDPPETHTRAKRVDEGFLLELAKEYPDFGIEAIREELAKCQNRKSWDEFKNKQQAFRNWMANARKFRERDGNRGSGQAGVRGAGPYGGAAGGGGVRTGTPGGGSPPRVPGFDSTGIRRIGGTPAETRAG